MHLSTVTIHTKSFGDNHSNAFYEKVARALLERFKILAIKHELYEYVNITTYWRKGCVIDDIVLDLNNLELIEMYLKSQKKFKQTDTYKNLLEKVNRIKEEFCDEKIIVEQITIEIFKILLSQVAFSSKGKILDKISEIKNDNDRFEFK